jgi:hypothetical protein
MKTLLTIILSINFCFAQDHGTFKNPKWTDYDWHVNVTGNIAAQTTSSFYFLTGRKGLSALLGSAVAAVISIVGKEYVYDKLMGRGTPSLKDIDGNITGIVLYTLPEMGAIDTWERKRLKLDTLQFQNLNTP